MSSRFTVRDLNQLKERKNAHLSPLEVIVHIDLDGFYAQCEQVRLDLTASDPVACRQWNSIIAVNYAAKDTGVTRRSNVDDALKLCPNIVLAHVATFKKGETDWSYHDNPTADEYKVCLDPFRRESRKIFSIIKHHCPVMEKASIDEAFVDLGAIIRSRALELFPELKECVSAAEASGNENVYLPEVPSHSQLEVVSLKWHGVLIRGQSDDDENDSTDTDYTVPADWDDLFIMIGSTIAQDIRNDIFSKLKYTCSAGVARNKILAKLASGSNKPNKQTIVRNCYIKEFLQSHELQDLWGFGGKLGDVIIKSLDIPEKESMLYLSSISQHEMERKLADAPLAEKVYKIIRGQFPTPVSTRITIKSMNSVKNFTKPVSTIADCKSWLRVLAADIAHRILELEDELATTVRPRTMSIHYNTPGGKSPKSKQSPYTSPRQYNFEQLFTALFEAAVGILNLLQRETVLLPSAMLSLSVSGLIIASNEPKTIDNFFSKYKEMAQVRDAKLAEKKALDKAKQPKRLGAVLSPDTTETNFAGGDLTVETKTKEDEQEDSLFVSGDEDEVDNGDGEGEGEERSESAEYYDSVTVRCPDCRERINLDDYGEHTDWHFASNLQKQLQPTPLKSSRPSSTSAPKASATSANSLKRKATTSAPRPKTTRKATTQSIMKFFSKKPEN